MEIAILILALLVLLNGLFAMAELAMMTSRHGRLQQMAATGSRGAAAALTLAREPTRFLSTVQVGITLIGILSGALGENAISERFEKLIAKIPGLEPHADTISLVIVVLLITYFSLVVGELVPKRIALSYPEAVAAKIARPLSVMSTITAWPVRFLSYSTEALVAVLRVKKTHASEEVSEADVRAIIDRAAGTGIFTKQEITLFQHILRAGDLNVGDIMVPRTEIVWIDNDESIETVRVLIGTSPFSHFPVCRGSLDRLIGVVHVKDLITYGLLAGADFKVSVVAHQPLCVPESLPALRLLDQFQKSKVHIAFVVDEHGGMLGMLTLNDITSTIVGDISRPGEAATATIVRRSDGSWLIDGRLPIHLLISELTLSEEAAESIPNVTTVGGVVPAILGRIPREGETVTWQGYRIEVIDMDGARVDKLLATRLPEAPTPSE